MSVDVDDVKIADFPKKVEIWSVNDKSESSDPQDNIKNAIKNTREECIIVGEVILKVLNIFLFLY